MIKRASRSTRRLVATSLAALAPAAFATLCWAAAGCRCPAKKPPLDLAGVDRSDGRIPELVAPRARGVIKIDGRLDEPAWRQAGDTGPFVHPADGKPRPESPVNASARLTWDEQRLYCGFVVHDRAPSSPFARDDTDPHLWEQSSAVELMIQPGDPGDNRHYYEVQVDTAGAVWDTRFDDYNRPITGQPGRRRFGHQRWQSGIERAVVVDRAAGRYTLELAIPWRAFAPPADREVAVPPKVGDRWRINLYSFRDGQRESLAWSPTLRQGNFHRASRFGRVVFSGGKSER